MTIEHHAPPAADRSVPSPLVGEGQAGGCHTTRSIDLREHSSCQIPAPPAGLPPSLALSRKGGGSAPFVRPVLLTRNNPAEQHSS
jgi:hypothetical protein